MEFRAICFLIVLQIQPTLQYTYFDPDPDSCLIIGDSDLYGLGIGLSFYLSWAGAWASVLFKRHDACREARKAANLVALAVLIDLIISTTQGSFALFEFSIVAPLALLPVGITILPNGLKKKDLLSMIFTCIVTMINCGIQPWLYFGILHQGYREGCKVDVFLFGPFSAYNSHWIGFCKYSAVMGGLTVVFLVYWVLRATIKERPLVNMSFAQGQELYSGFTKSKIAVPEVGSTKMHVYQCGMSLFFAGVLISFIEKTIQINEIDMQSASLRNASQLIPFTVGLFSLSMSIWSIMTEEEESAAEAVEHHEAQQPSPQRLNQQRVPGRNSRSHPYQPVPNAPAGYYPNIALQHMR